MILALLLDIVTEITIKANLDCRTSETGKMECRQVTPEPSPSPNPNPSPTPPPQVGNCISFGGASCYADDPPGLLRDGDGRFSKGSSGPNGNTKGKVITVTNTAGDNRVGSLLWANDQAFTQCPAKIVIPQTLRGTIVLETRMVMRAPYVTLDCSVAPPDFAITMKCTGASGECVRGNEAGPLMAGHDQIVHSCRGFGDFNPNNPQVPTNDLSVMVAGFNAKPLKAPCDDKWNDKTDDEIPDADIDEKRIVRDNLLSRNSMDLCRDDCGIVFDGVQDTSIVGNLFTTGWHNTTAGGIRPWQKNSYGERRRITYAYNAWDRVGARAIRATERVVDWHYVRNIISRRTSYVTRAGQRISPNTGLWLEDDYLEHDNGIVTGNKEIPGPVCTGDQKNNCMDPIGGGCIVGSTGNVCEHCGNCDVPSTNYAICNPALVHAKFFMKNNDWTGDCVTNPINWDGKYTRSPVRFDPAKIVNGNRVLQPLNPIPNLPEVGWDKILEVLGPVNKNQRELDLIEFFKANLP